MRREKQRRAAAASCMLHIVNSSGFGTLPPAATCETGGVMLVMREGDYGELFVAHMHGLGAGG